MTAPGNAAGTGEPGRLRIAVVGGGIAGLAAAWFYSRDHPDAQITVLEGGPRIGGKLAVSEVAGVPVDEGAEAILARRPEGVDLARAVGLDDDLVSPRPVSAGLWTRGKVRPLPAGTVMGVPGDLEALAASGVLSAEGVEEVRREGRLPACDLDGDAAIGELVASRMGREVVDRLVEPLLGGVYAGHADQLSLAATVPQLVEPLRARGSLLGAVEEIRGATGSGRATAGSGRATAGSTGPVFAGLVGGVGRLAGAVGRALESAGVAIRTGAMVRELHRTASGWRLVVGPTRAPESVEADAVVLACPARPASRLLADACPAAAAELAEIGYASMALVTLAYPSAALPQSQDAVGSGFLVPPAEGRTIKAATVLSAKWDWLRERAGETTLVRCSIGRYGEEAILQREDSELVQAAGVDLADALGVTGRPVEARVTRWGGALPQYTVGHRDRIDRIRTAVRGIPGLAVCGAAYDGLGVAPTVASARAAADQVGGAWTMGS